MKSFFPLLSALSCNAFMNPKFHIISIYSIYFSGATPGARFAENNCTSEFHFADGVKAYYRKECKWYQFIQSSKRKKLELGETGKESMIKILYRKLDLRRTRDKWETRAFNWNSALELGAYFIAFLLLLSLFLRTT